MELFKWIVKNGYFFIYVFTFIILLSLLLFLTILHVIDTVIINLYFFFINILKWLWEE